MAATPALERLQREVTRCEACPRLRRHCLEVAREKRRAFASQTYWGKPVPGFGDPRARLVLIGLAPAAHGANRTGRMFTGDRSGDWLYCALHKSGFANQPGSISRDDGLVLRDAYVTAVARCAPPANKPEREELLRCVKLHLLPELAALDRARVFLALGSIALQGVWPVLAAAGGGKVPTRPAFSHGGHARLPLGRHLLLSYHPSQQNTFTGKLTEPMFDAVFLKARELLA